MTFSSSNPLQGSTAPTRVALVGARGFGSMHLSNLRRLGDRVSLIALADPNGAPEEGFGSGIPCFPSLTELLASGLRPDVVIVATPTGTHFELARTALEHGADVYLEKPPVATMHDYEQLLALQAATGRAVQIGFQSMGSHALTAIADLGTPTSVATWATWVRDRAYWGRSPWAGMRSMDGRAVVDGVVTNPLAHAIATALRIAGARRREDVASVEVELLRANDIEADDTSSVRVRLVSGITVSAALTLCAAESADPVIEVRTPDADALFWYTEDRVRMGSEEVVHGRDDLFEQLLAHRLTGAALSSSLVDSGAFMEVLEAVRTAPEPRAVPSTAVRWEGGGVSAHPVIDDVDQWVERTARAGALFSELRVPWASPAPVGTQWAIIVGGAEVGTRNDGSTVAATSGPRPFLHPLRTPGGVLVTAAHPADHDWHLGVSVALQHVNGTNFWGGGTYVRDEGYRWLDDHGRIQTSAFTPTDDGFTQTAAWVSPSGQTQLSEHTSFSAHTTADAGAWTFTYTFTLTAHAETVRLGSPGSNGREGGGYGGLAWRLPAATDVRVRTLDAEGEDAVHGTCAPWLAWSGLFDGEPATIALAGADEATRADPWFVRVAAYPGIGSALAWADEVVLAPGESVRRSFRGLIADGARDDLAVSRLLGADAAISA